MKKLRDEKDIRRIQKWMGGLVTAGLVLVVVLCLYVVIQVLSHGYANLGGFMMFRVVTGSMEPEIPTGALLIAREVPIETIQLGDIVCFRTQLSDIWGKIVTHRVVGIMENPAGSLLLETKGDANLASDIFFVDQGNFVGKVVWYTGSKSLFAGMMSLFTNKIGFLGFIVIPVLLISTLILKDSVASIRRDMYVLLEESRRQQQVPSLEDDPMCGMTEDEYREMYERIRTELMEELSNLNDEILKEKNTAGDSAGSE